MGVDILHRTGGMLVARSCDVGIHVILRKAHLAADFIRVDLTLADQIIDRRLAHMEDLGHLLRGKGLVLAHGFSSSVQIRSDFLLYYTAFCLFSQYPDGTVL